MKPLNILVFPCGSEVALEIHRSLRYSRHVKLFGTSSVDDHGKFVFQNYTEHVPFITDDQFLPQLKAVVDKYSIDAIYPAMDAVLTTLKENESYLGCKVIASSVETTQICLSKEKTYNILDGIVPIPKIYDDYDKIDSYPLFMKPAVGYGSRGVKKINDRKEIDIHLKDFPNSLVLEFLPGDEYTIDCFTDRNGLLLFAGGRLRKRIGNGISVNTIPVDNDQFKEYAQKINNVIPMRGAWFFQLKENASGKLVLLEVASRIGGSSALYRNRGVNFVLLSIFDAFEYDLGIVDNKYFIELDRALDNQYSIKIDYDTAYIDFDDCLVVEGKINVKLVSFITQCINNKKKVILITKHSKNIYQSLAEYRLSHLFDEIIHIDQGDQKYKYMKAGSAIFIDDSFAERKAVSERLNIPVFSPDMVESLLEN